MVKPQPLLSVRDVPRASRWYQEVLAAQSGHGGDEYERLVVDDELVLQLHALDEDHHHGPLADPGRPFGNGVAVWFEVGMPRVSSGISVAVMAALLAASGPATPSIAPVVPNSSLCGESFFSVA